MSTNGQTAAGVTVPDTKLAREATELVRESTTDLVYHHSRRVFWFGSLQGRNRGLSFDPELLYIGAMFHDLGLNEQFRGSGRRFEVDSADEARRFLQGHGVPEDSIRRVWTAIALHTTPGIPEFMEPEVALVTAGVEYDVLGIGYHDISDADRAADHRPAPAAGLQAQHPGGIHRRHRAQAGNDVRQCQGGCPGAVRPRLPARQLRGHHLELRLAGVGAWPPRLPNQPEATGRRPSASGPPCTGLPSAL